MTSRQQRPRTPSGGAHRRHVGQPPSPTTTFRRRSWQARQSSIHGGFGREAASRSVAVRCSCRKCRRRSSAPKNILVRVERSCVSVGTEMAGIKMSGLPLLSARAEAAASRQARRSADGATRASPASTSRSRANSTRDCRPATRRPAQWSPSGPRLMGCNRRSRRLCRCRHRQPCRNHRRAGQSRRAGAGAA